MNVPYWSLIEAHADHYRTQRKPLWDTAFQYYNGNFYGQPNWKERGVMKASYNLIFAICETAVSAMLPPNPQLSGTPRGRMDYASVETANALMGLVLDKSRFRRECSYSLTESVLTGAGVFKTIHDEKKNRPVVRSRSPRNVWWDPTARRPEDIRYWIDVTPIPATVLKARLESGLYTPSEDISPDAYPEWLLEADVEKRARKLRDEFKWATVYEVYDVAAGKVVHVTKEGVLLEDELAYNPFSVFNLNWDGDGVNGLSELHLIISQQEEINALLSQWMKIAHLQVPRFLYDAGIVEEKDLAAALEGSTGSFTPVNMTSDQMKKLSDTFFAVPTAQLTSEQIGLIDRLEKIASVVSAMAEAARGQVTGAKTATEMAFIDANLRTRLVNRKGNFEGAIEDVGNKIMYAASRWMNPIELRVGEADPQTVDPSIFKDAGLQWKLNTYSPIKQNSAVYAETVAAILPVLRESTTFDQRDIDLLINDAFGLGLTPIPVEELAQQQADAELAQGAAMGQLPGQLEPNPAEVSPVSPQVAAQLPSAAEQVPQA